MRFPITIAALAAVSTLADAASSPISEFRYCPPTRGTKEQMQACSTVSQSNHGLEIFPSLYSIIDANSTTSMLCKNIKLQNDPVITILSSLLNHDNGTPGYLDGEQFDAGCESIGAAPWTVSVNKSISTRTILESWSEYASENGLDRKEGDIYLPKSISYICRLPVGLSYRGACESVLGFLYAPMAGLAAIFPYQFSIYCFLCWWMGSLVFDIAHWMMHRFHNSKSKVLRAIGHLHMIHHYYFNRNLQFNEKYAWHNTWVELPMEGLCHFAGSLLVWYACAYFNLTERTGYFTADVFRKIVLIQFMKTCYAMYVEGKDGNHPIGWKTIPKDPDFLSVGAEYHCLHHIEPDAYYSSLHRAFDHFIGASASFRGRRVLMTGSSGAYGQALIRQLQKQKVKSITPLKFGSDWTHTDFSGAISKLVDADILILAHGTKGRDAMQANCESAIALIELFRQHRKPAFTSVVQMLPEVWYLGSEIEIITPPAEPAMQRYSDSKRAFAPYARGYYDDKDFLYRHIVPAGFTSSMGKGLVSADWAASVSMFFIRRGARYVPVTYTTMAYWNYFKFMGLPPKRVEERDLKAYTGEVKAL